MSVSPGLDARSLGPLSTPPREPAPPGPAKLIVRTGPLHRVVAYVRARPVLVLMLLSPGIPEYLSGSSPISAIALNPGWFLLQLGLNLGLYVPGVLLIREARVRWNKGFLTVLVLGAAYAILEEGVALSTMFNPNASVVGGLGSYGHFLGVNTVWVPGILMIHMVYSIGLPILLLDLAIPETRGRSLISHRQIWTVLAVLGLDVSILFLVVLIPLHFFMGWALFIGSFAVIAALILLAYRLPHPSVNLRRARASPTEAFVLGVALFPGVLVVEALCEVSGVPAAGAIALACGVMLGIGFATYRWVRGSGNERVLLALSLGALAPIMLAGAVSQAAFDLDLVADVLLVLWIRTLWRAFPSTGGDAAAPGPYPPQPAV